MSTEKNTKQKKSIKNTLRNLLVLVLVAVISIAGTLAFLGDKTGKKVNTFAGSAGIDVTLTEPNWTTDDSNSNDIDGETMAESYTPEMEIPKDPTITNTSTSACKEWVAIRVDYEYDNTTATREKLEALVIEGIDFKEDWYKLNTKDGAADTSYEIYLYKNPLETDGTTGSSATLFEKIKIKDQTTLETAQTYGNTSYKVYNGTKYTNFEITVFGAAIKNDESLASKLSNIWSSINNYEIDMTDLDNQIATIKASNSATQESDSKLIALSLAKLLKELPTDVTT